MSGFPLFCLMIAFLAIGFIIGFCMGALGHRQTAYDQACQGQLYLGEGRWFKTQRIKDAGPSKIKA